MSISQPETCGKGLAENAALPAKLAELVNALAEVLSLHLSTIDTTDEQTRPEREAYRELTDGYRQISAQLASASQRMLTYQALPMGRHDFEAMRQPRFADAFARFIATEKDLLGLVEQRLEKDEAMLVTMRKAATSRRE